MTTMRTVRWIASLMALAMLASWPVAPVLVAQTNEIRTVVAKASFEDAKFGLTNAIINRGLVIDYTGRLGEMLTRTGKDVGSTKVIYKHAEYVVFCSSKLSRDMMEADPANIAMCPYVIFYYETAAKPGEVVIGYRRPPARGNAKSKAALVAVDGLLSAIIKEAAK